MCSERSQLNTSQEPNARHRPRRGSARRSFNSSSTVGYGFCMRIVALDYVVVRLAGEDLRVARIGEPVRVGHPHRLPSALLPAIEPCFAISSFQKNGISVLTPFGRVAALNRL